MAGPFLLLALLAQDKEGVEFFEQKIRPLLVERCYACHSAGAQKLKGNLRLDSRDGVLNGGDRGPAIVPGDPGKSLLLRALRHTDEELKMPPKEKLPSAAIADVEAWIRRGAPDPRTGGAEARRADPRTFWSFQPLRRPAPPAVRDDAWVRTTVDRFILARLEEKGLRPAPEADRRTLLRRVTFDLTGLPPSPEEIDAFLKDEGAGAYETVVDRLLASPRYGERWGRHWLDVARYADTHGYDKDKRRPNAWPYRDWVIRAFNDDRPYASFVRDQLAGDIFRPGDPDGIVATGFIAAGPWDFVGHMELKEGTPEKETTRVLDRDEMVSAVGSAFLGLTLHCARCHDHKFDPIPQKDYYALQAVFSGVERADRPYRETPEAAAARGALENRRSALAERRAELEKAAEALKSPELRELEERTRKIREELAAKKSPSNGYHSAIARTPDAVKWVQVDLGKEIDVDALGLVPARPTDFQDTPGFGFPERFRVELSSDPSFSAPVVVADHTGTDYPNPARETVRFDLKGRRARYVRVTAHRLWMRNNDWVFALSELEVQSGGANAAEGAEVSALDSIEAGRWSRRFLVDGFDSRRRLGTGTELDALEAERRKLYESLVPAPIREELAAGAVEFAGVEKGLRALPPPERVYAGLPRAPRPVHVLSRGSVTAPREAAAPGALSSVPGPVFALDRPDEEGQRRRALAEWIIHPENAFTWRALANRIWQGHFGRGIVDSPADFGWNGGRPSHPELLDWLACEVRDGGGSIKRLHRLLVTSAVYRQSGRGEAGAERVDSDNRLLGRMSRRRLDAESIRDAILSVSGTLDPRMGGPGYDLFAFKDDHSPHYDYATFARTERRETWRRTVYRFSVRSVPDPFLESLDAADPSQSVPVRHTTNTALQALALLNDPFVLRHAAHLATRLSAGSGDPGAQVDRAYVLLFGRPPSAEEREAVRSHAARHGLEHACRMLLNANEFVFVD